MPQCSTSSSPSAVVACSTPFMPRSGPVASPSASPPLVPSRASNTCVRSAPGKLAPPATGPRKEPMGEAPCRLLLDSTVVAALSCDDACVVTVSSLGAPSNSSTSPPSLSLSERYDMPPSDVRSSVRSSVSSLRASA
eukprot:6386470-Prymnesium_polylepis.3